MTRSKVILRSVAWGAGAVIVLSVINALDPYLYTGPPVINLSEYWPFLATKVSTAFASIVAAYSYFSGFRAGQKDTKST